ncbi:hypothetical protein KIN20_027291 [Parelaphostrongylus tenuis]|uniref:Uncharacterized protein n=1 Tax=Parelaphostrongylus tenuis TaxID=148309 RepID=A0AAD5QZE5_PARTN|nr:hypothetical protein KIN20_027291 [Parelaphostrongylus tenuis]
MCKYFLVTKFSLVLRNIDVLEQFGVTLGNSRQFYSGASQQSNVPKSIALTSTLMKAVARLELNVSTVPNHRVLL